MALNLSLSNYKTEEIVSNITKGNDHLLVPFCGELAYLDCKVVNKEKCDINIGAEYYIRTNIQRVKEILQRKNDKENQKAPINNRNLTKLDEDTFEIIENEEEALSNESKPQQMSISINEEKQKPINVIQEIKEIQTELTELKSKTAKQFLLDLIEKNKVQI